MKEVVNILATVLNPTLIDGTTFVFKTLRVGFPNADVRVFGNGLTGPMRDVVEHWAHGAGCEFKAMNYMPHDAWIENLVTHGERPFWICDTDVYFRGEVESWFYLNSEDTVFAGRFEQEFMEPWTGTRHVKRLHTALMWFNPFATRMAMRQWMCRIPPPWRTHADFPLIRQTFVPGDGETMFYDSCAGLHHAIGGTPFTEEQNQAFEHLHCATYAHLVSPALGVDLVNTHRAIYAKPELCVGMRKGQDAFYDRRAPSKSPKFVVPFFAPRVEKSENQYA